MRDFDSVAAGWDNLPRRVMLAKAVAEAVKSKLTKTDIRAMDFGCGTGLVTLGLTEVCREVIAADTSVGMLEQLRGKLAASGILNVIPQHISEKPDAALPDQLDLIVSSMTMHHIKDVGGMISGFHSLLTTGGMLCIADLFSEDGNFHDNPAGIEHHGFSIEAMEKHFSTAGFTSITSESVYTIEKERDGNKVNYPVILTSGRRND